MKINRYVALVSLCALLTIVFLGLAEAATGTLNFTFKYKNPTTGTISNLDYGYVYLRDASKPPPMESLFSKADYIGQRAFGNGYYSHTDIPVGSWYIRITQRRVQTGGPGKFGPPQENDYTWKQEIPITITAGQTLSLGTIYALPFSTAPITITGTIKSTKRRPSRRTLCQSAD